MIRTVARLLVFAAAPPLLLAGCSSGEATADGEDPSKLTAELEARASEIEARADEAVAEVEREAQAELAQLRIDAAEQDAARVEDGDVDTNGEADAAPVQALP